MTHIVAMAENGVIGRDGGLPWRISEDLKFFKATTAGHAVVMGRKTYASIGRPLPARLNVVITRDPTFAAEGVIAQPSLAAALAYCEERKAQWGDEVFVIGGGEIYRQSLAAADRIYLTRVHSTIAGDTTYPSFDLSDYTETVLARGAEPMPYTIVKLDRNARKPSV